MKDLEEDIEDAAFDLFLNEAGDMSKYRARDLAIKLSKSEAAKQYWQQGMYTKGDLKYIFEIFDQDRDFETQFKETYF